MKYYIEDKIGARIEVELFKQKVMDSIYQRLKPERGSAAEQIGVPLFQKERFLEQDKVGIMPETVVEHQREEEKREQNKADKD